MSVMTGVYNFLSEREAFGDVNTPTEEHQAVTNLPLVEVVGELTWGLSFEEGEGRSDLRVHISHCSYVAFEGVGNFERG